MSVVTHTYRFTGLGEDFGPRKGNGLVILHTTESANMTVSDAMALARWQDRDDTAGSYNRLIATDGVVSTVADDHASGGVNPFSPYFKPLAWLYEVLPALKVNDPNAYALQLSFMGRRASLDANGWPPSMIDYAARSILEEEERTGGPVVVANHADFQPGNRTDAGSIAMGLVKQRYAELTENALPALRPVRQQWTTGTGDALAANTSVTPGGQFWTLGPDQGERKWFTTPEKVWSVAESIDGLWRAIEYADELLWMHRYNLRPIAGTRNPATGYGTPVLSGGFTQTDIDKATAPLNERIARIKGKTKAFAADIADE